MKEIIKEGKVKTYKATCPYCGCEFTFNPSDGIDSLGIAHIVCPQEGCEGMIILDSTKYTEVNTQ